MTVAIVFAALAALVHVYIFWLESLAFMTTGRKAFGVSQADAEIMRPWAYNQGFYNLFLAVVAATGIGLYAGGHHPAGTAMFVSATGSMLAAALVLITSDGSKARGAVVQGLFPGLSLVAALVCVLR